MKGRQDWAKRRQLTKRGSRLKDVLCNGTSHTVCFVSISSSSSYTPSPLSCSLPSKTRAGELTSARLDFLMLQQGYFSFFRLVSAPLLCITWLLRTHPHLDSCALLFPILNFKQVSHPYHPLPLPASLRHSCLSCLSHFSVAWMKQWNLVWFLLYSPKNGGLI